MIPKIIQSLHQQGFSIGELRELFHDLSNHSMQGLEKISHRDDGRPAIAQLAKFIRQAKPAEFFELVDFFECHT
jgi:DNA-binding transcriptional MerR regulator